MTTARVSSRSSRKPAHQNHFAYQHNKHSRRTQYIRALPVSGICRRCEAKIEWRKQFRKYKPLTVPHKCQGCGQKAIKQAYHVLCEKCAQSQKVCAMCRSTVEESEEALEEQAAAALIEEARGQLRERERRQLARILETRGEQAALQYLQHRVTGAPAGGAGPADADDDCEDSDVDDSGDESPEDGRRSHTGAAATAAAAAPAAGVASDDVSDGSQPEDDCSEDGSGDGCSADGGLGSEEDGDDDEQ